MLLDTNKAELATPKITDRVARCTKITKGLPICWIFKPKK